MKRLISFCLALALILVFAPSLALIGTAASQTIQPNKLIDTIKVYDDNGVLVEDYIYQYDESNRLISISENTDPYTSTYPKSFTYDSAGRLTSIMYSGSGDGSVEYIYNDKGQLVQSNGSVSDYYEYNSAGQLIKLTSSYHLGSDVTTYTYDASGNLINTTTTYTYDPDWTDLESPPPRYSTYSYDSQNRVSKIVSVSGSDTTTTTYTYDSHSRVVKIVSVSDSSTSTTTYSYDYKPFILRSDSTTYGSTEYTYTSLIFEDESGNQLEHLPLSNPQLYTDSDGYLTKIVEKDDYSGEYTWYFTHCDANTQSNQIEINESNFPDANFRAYILSQTYGADGVLTQKEIQQITYLNVSGLGIADLTGIEHFTALDDLECYNNQLTNLDISKNTALTDLDCYGNQLTNLDISKNTALTELWCSENRLTSLDVSKNTALLELWCDENQLISLDVSKNTALVSLSCRANKLTNLDVSKNPALEVLWCNGNHLTNLDFSQNKVLKNLRCYENSYAIVLDGSNQFDLSTLPGDFNASKASNWVGGTVNGNILTAISDKITYTYQMGKNWSETFTLSIQVGVLRLAGDTRFETAFEIADELKEIWGVNKFNSIIIASGTSAADALSGAYLANVKSAPILLTCNKDFNPRLVETYNNMLVEYIKANMAPGGTVYILGGEKAVDPSLDAALTGYRVVRLAGATRYETNLEILKETGVGNREVLICYGEKFPDSLAASATGNPILLVRNKLTDAQKSFLNTTSGKFVIIGGTAVISNDLENSLKNYGSTERLAGSNRYTTCVMVAERFFDQPSTAVVAYGENFPDGLCGGILAYSMDAPLILVREDYLKAATDYTAKNAIYSGIVLGGEGLISDASIQKIFGN